MPEENSVLDREQKLKLEELISHLRCGRIYRAIEIKEEFPIRKEFYQTKKFMKAAEEGLIKNLAQGDFWYATEIKEEFPIKEEIVQKAAEEGLIKNLEQGDVWKAIEIKGNFQIKEEFYQTEEFMKAVEKGIIKKLKQGKVWEAVEIKDFFPIREDSYQTEEFMKAVKEGLIKNLDPGKVWEAVEIKEKFPIMEEFYQTKEYMKAVEKGLIKNLEQGDVWGVTEIRKKFPIRKETVQKVVEKGLIEIISQGDIRKATKIKDNFPIREEFYQTEEFMKAAEKGIITKLYEENINVASKIKDTFSIPFSVLQDASERSIFYFLSIGDVRKALDIYEEFHPHNSNLFDVNFSSDSFLEGLMFSFDLWDLCSLLDFCSSNFDFIDYLSGSDNRKVFIDRSDLDVIRSLHLSLTESEELTRLGINLSRILEQQSYDYLSDVLMNSSGVWNNDPILSDNFLKGSEVFGPKMMLKYSCKLGVTRHDALFSFDAVLRLYSFSGLTPEQFYSNILHQVWMDGSEYDVGTSHHLLNSIAKNFEYYKYEEIIERAKHYKDLDCLQNLIEDLDSKDKIFSSWKNLKKYEELTQLLKKTKILNQLRKLKEEGKEELYSYIEKLAFHKSINLEKVLKFWKSPAGFFNVNSGEINPLSYTEEDYIDLTPEELRDSIVEGHLDSLQVFSPMTIVYKIPRDLNETGIKQNLESALGKYSQGIKGKAKQPKKVYHRINQILKKQGLDIRKILQGEEISEDLEDQINKIIFDKEIGMSQKKYDTYLAKIALKSDIDSSVAGDDTSCCMPFGSAKNTDYTLNPNTAIFIIQKQTDDGFETIAQSLITKDKKLGIEFSELEKKIKAGKPLSDILPEEILKESLGYISCDNIEVKPNRREKEQKIIEMIYFDFFSEYLENYAIELKLKPTKIIIGLGCSDALKHTKKEKNQYAPQTVIGYSDKTGEEVGILNLLEDRPKLKKKIQRQERKKTEDKMFCKGVKKLTFEDTIQTAFLESKVYKDNEELINGIFEIQKELISKDLNNKIKGRKNLSLKYIDEKGSMKGYMIAYEGKIDDQKIIYISDMAATTKIAAGKIMKEFIEQYKENYIKKQEQRTILIHAREKTTYKMIKKQGKRMEKQIGRKIEITEGEKYKTNKERFREIKIKTQ